SGGVGGAALQTRTGMVTMRIDTMDAAPVKGAPFCATVVTEHTQSLADGNRIHTSDSSMLCRDSEGRIRREAGLNLLEAGQQTSAPKLITIVDPIAGVRYMLDTENKIAQKMPLLPEGGFTTAAVPGPAHAPGKQVMIYQRTGGPGSDVMFNDVTVKKIGPDSGEPAPNTENLGDQTIDGIHVTGTRMTHTIPAGKMGNEKPITVTSERWYSPELKATVTTKHNDPWAGELKTELKNVSSSEPDASLFAIPADYKVIDDKDGPIRIKLHAPAPPPQ
ncbi:MAG TPA: hypothetical protein VNS62_04795, partial [Candidatus Udaeobacter sp.]|nr:hypothetical protein [Candidatus Udaeobacter sp.]